MERPISRGRHASSMAAHVDDETDEGPDSFHAQDRPQYLGRKRARSVSPMFSVQGEIKSSRPQRSVTVYDAVAGRIAYTGFIDTPTHNKPPTKRDTQSHGTTPLTAEEILIDRKNAPEYDDFSNVFDQRRQLVDTKEEADAIHRYLERYSASGGDKIRVGTLPDSDMLKAIHAYASDFYSAATADGGRCDWKSMDETALLACGLLVEEWAKKFLGENGDLVLTEGVDDESLERDTEGHGGRHEPESRRRKR